jgi:hypothetical protein
MTALLETIYSFLIKSRLQSMVTLVLMGTERSILKVNPFERMEIGIGRWLFQSPFCLYILFSLLSLFIK